MPNGICGVKTPSGRQAMIGVVGRISEQDAGVGARNRGRYDEAGAMAKHTMKAYDEMFLTPEANSSANWWIGGYHMAKKYFATRQDVEKWLQSRGN